MSCPRVLVVESNEDNRTILLESLQLEGFECCAVASHEEALRQLLSGCTANVIIVDVSPPYDFRFVSKLRADERTRNSAILVTTTLDPKKVPEGTGDHVFLKPYGLDELSTIIKAAWRNRQTRWT